MNLRCLLALCALLLVAGSCGPPPPAATINNTIISTQLTGNADDGDPANPPQQYLAPGSMQAKDGATNSASNAAQFNKVGGNAHAIPGPNVGQGEAVASSMNKVVTQFVVNRQGAFTFDLNLDVKGVKIAGKGRVAISVRAVVLDANGNVILDAQGNQIPNQSIAFLDIEVEPDGAGGLRAIIGGDRANPDPLAAGGNYQRRISGPNGGVNLPPGNYRIEMDLRLRCRAPADSRAEIDGATLDIALR
jgi:hypothetical protein